MATKKAANKNLEPAPPVMLRVKKEKGKPRGQVYAHLAKYQYPKGKSGNPGGVPKAVGTAKLSAAYEAVLGEKLPEELCEALGIAIEDGKTWADAIALQAARKAIDANIANPSFTAITELRETTEGKTPDKAELAGAGGAPLAAPNFQVNFVKPESEQWDETPVVET